MATTEIKTRIWMILIIFLFITSLYTIEGIYLVGARELITPDESQLIQVSPELQDPQNYSYGIAVEQATDPLGIIQDFFKFLTFQPLGIPSWVSVLLTMSIIIVNIILAFIVYSLIRDWVPFLG